MTRMEVLKSAVRTAIRNGCDRKAISVPHWSATYALPQSTIRKIWESELTKETNANSIGGDGK